MSSSLSCPGLGGAVIQGQGRINPVDQVRADTLAWLLVGASTIILTASHRPLPALPADVSRSSRENPCENSSRSRSCCLWKRSVYWLSTTPSTGTRELLGRPEHGGRLGLPLQHLQGAPLELLHRAQVYGYCDARSLSRTKWGHVPRNEQLSQTRRM